MKIFESHANSFAPPPHVSALLRSHLPRIIKLWDQACDQGTHDVRTLLFIIIDLDDPKAREFAVCNGGITDQALAKTRSECLTAGLIPASVFTTSSSNMAEYFTVAGGQDGRRVVNRLAVPPDSHVLRCVVFSHSGVFISEVSHHNRLDN